MPAFLELLVEDVVLLQETCEFQSRIGEHHPERALDVFRPGGRVDLIEGANELRSDVLFVGISQMLGTELDSFSFAVVTVIDFNDAATGLIDYDAVRPAIILIEIAADADEKQQSQDDPAACEVNNGANILRVAVNGTESQRIALGVGTRNGRDARVVVIQLMTSRGSATKNNTNLRDSGSRRETFLNLRRSLQYRVRWPQFWHPN